MPTSGERDRVTYRKAQELVEKFVTNKAVTNSEKVPNLYAEGNIFDGVTGYDNLFDKVAENSSASVAR